MAVDVVGTSITSGTILGYGTIRINPYTCPKVDYLLAVTLFWEYNPGNPTVSVFIPHWVSPTDAQRPAYAGGNDGYPRAEINVFANPYAGSGDLNYELGNTDQYAVFAALGIRGASSVIANGFNNKQETGNANGTSASHTISSNHPSGLILSALVVRGAPAVTPGAGQTVLVNQVASSIRAVVTSKPGGTSVVSSFSWSGAQNYAMVSIAIEAKKVGCRPMIIY